MRVVAIIQARMGSSRLPGKVLMPLAGRSVLERVIRRVQEADVFDEIAVATTTREIDDPICNAVAGCGVRTVRGDENDVLGRYGVAAAETDADVIMRITADCPLIDKHILATMVRQFLAAGTRGRPVDVLTNTRTRTFPRGLDAELFSRAALDDMLLEAEEPAQREHVTPFLYAHPERFNILDYLGDADHSSLRLTLDTPEDYELLCRIYNAAPDPEDLWLESVLRILNEHRHWREINAGVEQKPV